jgi:uncharacterized protein YecE (DUF72 family)
LNEVNSINQSRWRVGVEFRDAGWYNEEVLDLLRSVNASLVLQDIPKPVAPIVSTSDEFIYVRFHGPTGNYRGSYPGYFLKEYATYILEWLAEGKKVYVYFNNTAGDAFLNLRTLQEYLT